MNVNVTGIYKDTVVRDDNLFVVEMIFYLKM